MLVRVLVLDRGGDTGADAAVGTTSGETGEEGTTDTGSSGVPKEERWSYLGNNRWIRVKGYPCLSRLRAGHCSKTKLA